MSVGSTIARGPLIDLHRRCGATVELIDGWQIAVRYPQEGDQSCNLLVDFSHGRKFEINGPGTDAMLVSLCGADVPLRKIHCDGERQVYRLTPSRAIVFGKLPPGATALDVTGGWSSLALFGPDAEQILNKVTAVDLRERTLPMESCCQGPIFGVNTLFGRFEGYFHLHVCSDSAEFFWEVLLDAGQEFGLKPAGLEAIQ